MQPILIPGATLIDGIALAVFLVGWFGYTWWADHPAREARSLGGVMHRHRQDWMRRMLERDNRIPDSQILMITMRNVSLFASISVLILGGLVAVMGSLERLTSVMQDLPFVAVSSQAMLEIKVLVLSFVFIYAFFKFAWSLRQFNYTATVMGAAPHTPDAPDAAWYLEHLPKVGTLAVRSYNRGIRAYYFGLAMLSWFLHPLLFIAATIWVVLILHRREFRSNTWRALKSRHDGE